MKITRLRLENFRIHRDTVLAIGDNSFVVIRGRNFAGKSTIGQALSMCLTPTAPGLDSAGRDYQSKIKRGADKAVITADIQAKRYLIQRTVTLNTNTSGRTRFSVCLSDPDWNPAPFDKKLEEHKAALIVALNTDAFLLMGEKEQKNLLAGLALPARYDFDREIVESVNTALENDAPNFEGEPFVAINQAYKKLFEERQAVNRRVRETTIPDPLPVPVGVDSHALQDRLTSLRMERRTCQERRDDAVGVASRAEVERERIKAKKKSLLSDEKLVYLRKIAARKEEFDRLTKERKRNEAAIDEHLKYLGKLDMIPDDTTKCPTCDQVIDPERLKEMVAISTVSLQEVRDHNLAVYREIKALGDVSEAADLIAKHEATLKELAAVEMPEPVLFDFRPYDQTIGECDAEIEKLSAQLRPVIAAEERAKEIAIRQEQFDRLKEKAALLDRLVKYFDKDGIKAKLLGEYIGGFECKINEVMGAWGYSCALSIEPYSFDVTNARGDVNPVKELSGSERLLFSIALQCAVSRTAGIGLVVADEITLFLPELRPVLFRRLFEMIQNGYLEQTVLLIADTSEVVPNLPGSVFFLVEDGAVRRLEREVAVAS